MNKKTVLIIGGCIISAAVLAVVCFSCGLIGFAFSQYFQPGDLTIQDPVEVVVNTPAAVLPTIEVGTEGTPDETQVPHSQAELIDTLRTLEEAVIPINDPVDLALRLEGKENIPRTLPVENLNRKVGEQESFWVSNTDTAENFLVETTLAAVTDHVYFWIENGVDYSDRALNRLVTDFEENIYPTNREFFGSEWSPGVDEDPHLYVIYATGIGSGVAGYFSSSHQYHPMIDEYSNAHETFLLSADNVKLSDDYMYGVMAHEFQHMIHWYRDRNETSWLNEGFSELATLLTGHRVVPGHDYWYADDPDSQLNDWPNDPNNDFATIPHYGSSFLFVTYFLDRFGNEATQALVSSDLNGLASVDAVLEDLGTINPDTGQPMTADDVYMDWVVTNYLKDEYNVTDRFVYSNYPGAPQFYPTEEIDQCPTDLQNRDVSQYGVDYLLINCPGSYQVNFQGEQTVQVIPEDAFSGEYAFWSNKGDQSDITLTREFDFSEVQDSLTLVYWTWYDLEEDYDYLYLEVSENGEDWEILKTPSGTDQDPSGNSYGWGYNGLSGGNGSWIRESIDLSSYAGKKVQIRFEYITDDAVHGEGFLLDDVAIPEINYFTDFEDDQGGWTGEGFVRIKNILPQTYRVAFVKLGAVPSVEYLPLSADNQLDFSFTIGDDSGTNQVLLVVSGTTRYTRQRAPYQYQISN